jgi:hypothetical protein
MIYAALFLREEEEGQLENRLEQWWQKIRLLHTQATSRETAFLKVVAQITAAGFAKVFGERLLGPKAIAASVSYSMTAVMGALAVGQYEVRFEPMANAFFWWLIGLSGLFFIVLGSLGPFVKTVARKTVWLVCVLTAAITWAPLADYAFARHSHGPFLLAPNTYMEVVCMLPLAVGCDFVFIALTRAMLSWAARSNSLVKIAGLAICNSGLAVILVFLPVRVALFYYSDSSVWMSSTLLLIACSNVLELLVSSVAILVAFAMLLHRFLWPLMERPIYALHRHHVFTNQKKLLFFGGVALVGMAIPSVGKVLENVIRAVHA